MKVIKKIGLVLICVFFPVAFYLNTPVSENQTKPIEETKVILVNQDEGIEIGESYYNFAQNLIDVFVKESEFSTSILNYADAINALENNEAMYVIVFEPGFSKNVNRYDIESPIQGTVRYYYNHMYNENDGRDVLVENHRTQVFEELKSELSKVYMKTIVAQVGQSKEMLTEDIDSDIQLVEGIKLANKENTTILSNKVTETNEHISGFNNTMGEKIAEVGSTINESNLKEKEILSQANEVTTSIESGQELHETLKVNVENGYLDSYTQYQTYSDIVEGESGLATQSTEYYIPMYNLYNQQYSENLSLMNQVVQLDTNSSGVLCSEGESGVGVSELKTYLLSLTAKQVNIETKVLEDVTLFNDVEVDQWIGESLAVCNGAYQLVDKPDIQRIYDQSKKILANKIVSDTQALGIDSSDFLLDTVIVQENGLSVGYTGLSEQEILEFNAFNLVMAILNNQETYVVVTYDPIQEYYMLDEDYTAFDMVKAVVLSNYADYAGIYGNITEIVDDQDLGTTTSFYGINVLQAQDQTIFKDIQGTLVPEEDYVNSLFYDDIEEKVVSAISSKFFQPTTEAITLESFGGGFALFIADKLLLSSQLSETYEEAYDNHLQKLSEDSVLLLSNYEKTDGHNQTIIETGEINLENFEAMHDKNQLVVEENNAIMNHFTGIRERNTAVNEVVISNSENYLSAVKQLEENNDNQKEFVDEYGQVLNYANVDGVSNNKFYSFVTQPISFIGEDVNESGSAMDIYFIILWLLVGVVLINVAYDCFYEIFKINFKQEDFKENKVVDFFSRYFLYGLSLKLLAISYGIVLSMRFNIEDAGWFILQLIILTLLLGATIRALIQLSKVIGYSCVTLVVASLYIIIYSNQNTWIEKILALPVISLNNFIRVSVYQHSYANAFLYSVIVYGALLLSVLVISVVYTMLKNREKRI